MSKAAELAKVHGKCSVCGLTGAQYQNNGKYKKPYYHSVFERVSWFRGDDEYIGKICKKCLKQGKIDEVSNE